MNKVSRFFMALNPLVKLVLSSSLHGLGSSQLMLVKFTGRKSGEEFVTPMAYHQFDDTIIIALAETAGRQWWKNYREVWPMQVLIKGHWQTGYASLVKPERPEYQRWFELVFQRAAFIPKIFSIDYDRQQGLQADQLLQLAAQSAIVKFTTSMDEHL